MTDLSHSVARSPRIAHKCMRGRVLIGLSAAILVSACSSLQIDVDVYKGPLIQEREIQLRHYLSLAISAKPLLNDLYDKVNEQCLKQPIPSGTHKSDPSRKDGELYLPLCSEVNGVSLESLYQILALYEDQVSATPGNATQYPLSKIPEISLRPVVTVGTESKTKGLITLSREVTEELDSFDYVSDEEKKKKFEKSVAALNGSLISFAQKILFTANNLDIYAHVSSGIGDDLYAKRKRTDSGGSDIAESVTSVLQSLGNTIMVQANDLQRQRTRDGGLSERAKSEINAIGGAFRVSPSAAYEQILELLDPGRLASQKPVKEATSFELDSTKKTANDELKQLKQKTSEANKRVTDYIEHISQMIATYRTVVGEADRLTMMEAVGPTELDAAKSDRQTIAGLYPENPVAEKDKPDSDASKPLQNWLAMELSASIDLVPQRKLRLDATSKYMSTEISRLWAGSAVVETQKLALKAMTARLSDAYSKASNQLEEYRQIAQKLHEESMKLEKSIAKKFASQKVKKDAVTEANKEVEDVQKILAVVKHVRRDILDQGDTAKLTDPGVVLELLKLQLAVLKPDAVSGKPSAEDIAMARSAVAKLPTLSTIGCASKIPGNDGSTCDGSNQIEVINSLISTLRAKRIQALAGGATREAGNLQNAIDAAYEQRTSMLFLRPASDYLRSVYTASAFQDGNEPLHRNMLTEWASYLKPTWAGFDKLEGSDKLKAKIEKQHWQNINKVTLSGGGKTNYVLAKDDVGNWYVKAYSTDPKDIIKSATSLALFNSGKAINTNLLQRNDLQRQIDSADTTFEQKKVLRAEMNNLNGKDSGALLKMRNHYAQRYQAETVRQAQLLQQGMAGMSDKIIAKMDALNTEPACTLDTLKTNLTSLDAAHLQTSVSRLQPLIESSTGADLDKLTIDFETAMQGGMTSLRAYADKVSKSIKEFKPADCKTSWPADDAAKFAKEQAIALLRTIATERKSHVERYEDALNNLAEIAAQP